MFMLAILTANVNHVVCVSRIKAGVAGDLCYGFNGQLMAFPLFFFLIHDAGVSDN